MCKARVAILLACLLGIAAFPGQTARAQSFGGAFQRRRIVLVRKLPPTGHIDGSSFTVNVTGPGIPGDVLSILKSTIESDLVANDPRLRSVAPGEHPDAVINVQVTTYTQPPPQPVQEQTVGLGAKNGLQNVSMTRVTGLMEANFNAQDLRASRSIAANTLKMKFDQEFAAPPPAAASAKPSWSGILSAHIPKVPTASPGGNSGQTSDKPPTPQELKNLLIQNMAMEVASNLVNTSEQVDVNLAVGGGLDEPDRLMDQKLWTRALEALGTMTPYPDPAQDAYRLYDLGVVNEALGYQAEDVPQARKYLQEAAIDYGKAIDARPSEKNFLEPQTRIDTALAHYKTLGDRKAEEAANASAPPPAPATDALTNADVIAMVGAKLDEGNIVDTIQHAGAVKFDLSARGQIDLAKANVNGRIIAAMKQKSRTQ